MDHTKKGIDKYLIFVLFIAALFVAYWVYYAMFNYQSFSYEFYDIGQETYGMYLHLHNPGLISGLQYLSFSNHIDPFKILLLPIFALNQTPFTLFFLQALSLALAAIVAYFIGKDILHNQYVGLALALAFFLSPGVSGITIFQFHVEAFIPLFYLLSFYFYMRNRKFLFFASYMLMLSVVESAPFVGITFIVGMLLYEELYWKHSVNSSLSEHKTRLKILAAALIITILFALFYYYTTNALLAMYSTGHYQNMPPYLKVVDFFSIYSNAFANSAAIIFSNQQLLGALFTSLIILFLGFGITNYKVLPVTMALYGVWVIELIFLHNALFNLISNHYYALIVGGEVAATTLGFIVISQSKTQWLNKLSLLVAKQFGFAFPEGKPYKFNMANFLASLMILFSLIIFFAFISIFYYSITPSLTTGQVYYTYTFIDSYLRTIPTNASVLAQPSIASHMYYFTYLELPPDYRVPGFTARGFSNLNITVFYERPTYIVTDSQFKDFFYMSSMRFNASKYMGDNYTLYNSSGALSIYKLLPGR